MGKAIDSAMQILDKEVKDATDITVTNIKQGADDFVKETEKVKNEIVEAKREFRIEKGFRKFMFWATPILLLAQSIVSIFLLLG